MAKIKFQGGLTKLLASKIAKRNKEEFGRYIEINLVSLVKEITNEPVTMEVVSFSSSRDFYDQVLSILSFIKYIGIPSAWTLYSDGSHNFEQKKLLRDGFPFLKIVGIDWENLNSLPENCKENLLPYSDQFLDYAKKFPLGKKLFHYLNHPIEIPTLFLDSDILFYEQASTFKFILKEQKNGWYLPDGSWGCLDSRYKEKNLQQPYQVNSGFFLCNKELTNLEDGFKFLKEMNFKYEYFSEQSIFHILFRSNDYMPLDPRIFILNSRDQFDFSYLYPRSKMAMRHYTGPVRHKMWQKNWKWHLSLS